MENKKGFSQFELNLIELFEALQGATVSEKNGTYYASDGYEYGYTKDSLLLHCIYGINNWYKTTDTTDMLNNDFILENTTDYLQLLLSLPSNTTVLAVGNGAVAAPSTTTAYLHQSPQCGDFLAIYDYEDEDGTKAMKEDLESLFPTAPACEKSFAECFYTGGGVWCTVYQLGGDMSDYYYSVDNNSDDWMYLYSHKGDRENGFDDEYGFYSVVDLINIKASASIAEKDIYNRMKAEEAKTLKEHGII